jgi:hypothetical protein
MFGKELPYDFFAVVAFVTGMLDQPRFIQACRQCFFNSPE